ncbi:hypothetical protein GPK34_00360 [Secundilactobacillus kimchicus]|uniref:hypothetical protein n=1 Tax=Secundilactobacillus kimchicus TaxID=528209 RepID=UPI001C01C3EC|nr:hypothetical protein [Secundilactobacillus kimchicus]MBT9670489.1 hypothetical protein [Secundilactobacillus kimchicus]
MTNEITETKALEVAKKLDKETLLQVVNDWLDNESIEHMDFVLRQMREDENFQGMMIKGISTGHFNVDDEYVLVSMFSKDTDTSDDFTKWLADEDYTQAVIQATDELGEKVTSMTVEEIAELIEKNY